MNRLAQLERDSEGYLRELADWCPEVAVELAAEAEVELNPAHWEILELLRRYYQEFDHAPAMRPLVNYIKRELGAERGNSLYLLKLFPDSPAKLAAKIAGLPRPDNCL
jgi:tRNA 2-thiouridine synthesizing protein E